MPARDIKIYDEPWPTVDEVMFGPRKTPIPNPNWREKMLPDEVALFYRHFQTNGPVSHEGRPISPGDETALAFATREEAEAFATSVVAAHPTVACEIRDRDDHVLKRIANNRKIALFSLFSTLGLLLWLGAWAAVGAAITYLVGWKALQSLHNAWLRIGLFAVGTVIFSSVAFYAKTAFKTASLLRNMKRGFSQEELAKFAELNHSPITEEERVRHADLSREYLKRLRENARS